MSQQRVSIDTRTIQTGDIFIPVGNGQAFCDDALKKGATVLDVNLTEYAKNHRQQFTGEVIAVIGSFGKTTLKDYLSYALKDISVSATEKNFNNEIGVPLTIANAKLTDSAWIIECGIRKPGDMTALRDIVQPTMVVFSGFGYSHMEFYDHEHDLLSEKLSIICPQTKHLFLPSNIRYLSNIQSTLNDYSLNTHIIPVDQLTNTPFMLTNAICSFFNIEPPSKQSLTVTHSPHRLKKHTLNKGITLIDDTYNSNPIAVQYAVETVLNEFNKNKVIIVLGDMLELGKTTNQMHTDILTWCNKLEPKAVLTFGSLFSSSNRNFSNHESLYQVLKHILFPNDTLLIKGSRSNQLDKIIDLFTNQSLSK